MRFLKKIEAIHPRGRKYERQKPPKRGFSLPKGKSLKERLDWISSSVHDLINDYDFKPSTNKLFAEVVSLHDLVTDSMPIELRLHSYLKLTSLAPKMAKEVQRLYASGGLPDSVDRDMVHALIEESKAVEEDGEEILKSLKDYEEFKKGLAKLGFK